MFCIDAEVFGNTKSSFFAYNWVFMAGLWVVWLVFRFFMGGLGDLSVVWVVYGWFG